MPELSDLIRVYDDALAPDFCARLVSGFEQTRALQVRNGRGVRPGLEDSAWTELDVGQLADDAFRGFFLSEIERALGRYNADVKLGIPVPIRPRTDRLILKRYRPGGSESFQPHFDSIDEVCGRYLVFLWYLNDVPEGGETEFVDLGIKVAPRTGRLLMFPPYWMFQHAGRPPAGGDKYILSTYLMFGRA
jgi:prolyl 4-hydroxylase